MKIGHLVTDYLIEDNLDLGIEGRNDVLVDNKRRCLCLAYQFVDSIEG